MDKEKLNDLKNNGVKVVTNDKKFKDEEKKVEDDENEESLFDNLIQEIGNDGKFQTRSNYMYNLVFVMLVTMPFTNYILAMTIPDHWCSVPGREYTNYSVEEWKEKWLPKYATFLLLLP